MADREPQPEPDPLVVTGARGAITGDGGQSGASMTTNGGHG
jgi:hypothetical protein